MRQWLDTAEGHTRAGRLRRAVTFYRKVLAVSRVGEYEHELAHVRLGDLHLGRGRPELAVSHLERARRLTTDEPQYALMAGRAHAALGAHDRARAHLFDAMHDAHHASDALAELARVAGEAGDRSTARTLAAHAARRASRRYRGLARRYADA